MALAVMGILLENRREQAPQVQEVLTKYGDLILARSGVHDPTKDQGLISLTVEGADEEIGALAKGLKSAAGASVSTAFFDQD